MGSRLAGSVVVEKGGGAHALCALARGRQQERSLSPSLGKESGPPERMSCAGTKKREKNRRV
jgi:hypothetical protein